MVFYGIYSAERQPRVAPARTVRAGNMAPRIRRSGNVAGRTATSRTDSAFKIQLRDSIDFLVVVLISRELKVLLIDNINE